MEAYAMIAHLKSGKNNRLALFAEKTSLQSKDQENAQKRKNISKLYPKLQKEIKNQNRSKKRRRKKMRRTDFQYVLNKFIYL